MPVVSPWAFVLAVRDMRATADYFRDILGFRIQWEDATDWRLVERNGVRFMIGHCPGDARPIDIGSHNLIGYLGVDDVDGLHCELSARGAVCTPPKTMPYGMREIVVTTPDGHRIVFGQNAQ